MNQISLAWYSPYAGNTYKGNELEYLTECLSEELCKCYGFQYPEGFKINPSLKDKMVLSKLPTRTAFISKPLLKIFHQPDYYSRLIGQKMMEELFWRKVSEDNSKILYTAGNLEKIVSAAKDCGKEVVLQAGEMHPRYEYEVLTKEYEIYNSKNRYIYADLKYIEPIEHSIQQADMIIPISRACYQTYLDYGISEQKLKYIPLATPDIAVNNSSTEKQNVFITTAFHSFVKGTHRLLLAWEKANITNMPLIVVGEMQRDMIEFVEKYGPFHNVYFVGNKNIYEFYKMFQAVGILLSFAEGMVRVVPEYLRFGFPVIVSPAASADVVIDNENGFIVNPEKEEEIILKMKQFSENLELITSMGKNAKTSVRGKGLEEYARNVADFLMEELGKLE